MWLCLSPSPRLVAPRRTGAGGQSVKGGPAVAVSASKLVKMLRAESALSAATSAEALTISLPAAVQTALSSIWLGLCGSPTSSLLPPVATVAAVASARAGPSATRSLPALRAPRRECDSRPRRCNLAAGAASAEPGRRNCKRPSGRVELRRLYELKEQVPDPRGTKRPTNESESASRRAPSKDYR